MRSFVWVCCLAFFVGLFESAGWGAPPAFGFRPRTECRPRTPKWRSPSRTRWPRTSKWRSPSRTRWPRPSKPRLPFGAPGSRYQPKQPKDSYQTKRIRPLRFAPHNRLVRKPIGRLNDPIRGMRRNQLRWEDRRFDRAARSPKRPRTTRQQASRPITRRPSRDLTQKRRSQPQERASEQRRRDRRREPTPNDPSIKREEAMRIRARRQGPPPKKAAPLSPERQNLATYPLKTTPANSREIIQPKPKATAVHPPKTMQPQRKTTERSVSNSPATRTKQAHLTHPKYQNASQSPATKVKQPSQPRQPSPLKATPSNQPSKQLTDAEKLQRSRRQALDQQLRALLKEHGFRQKKTVPSLEKMPFDPIEKQDFLRKRKLVMEYNRIVEQTNSARESGHQLKKSILAYNDAKTPEERKKAYNELAQRYRAFWGSKEKWMKEAQAFERNQKKYNIFLIKKEIFQKSIHARNQGSSEAFLHFMKVRNLERTQQFADFIQPIADKAKGQLKAKAEKKLIEYFPGIRDYLKGLNTAYTRLSAAAPQEGNMPHKTLIEIANADKAFASRLLPKVKDMLPQHRKILLRYVDKTLKQREALNDALVKWKQEDFPQNIARDTRRYQTTVPPSVADWLELNGQTGRAVGDSLSSFRQLSKALKQQTTGTIFQGPQKQTKK